MADSKRKSVLDSRLFSTTSQFPYGGCRTGLGDRQRTKQGKRSSAEMQTDFDEREQFLDFGRTLCSTFKSDDAHWVFVPRIWRETSVIFLCGEVV